MNRWFSVPSTYSEDEQVIARLLNMISFIITLAAIFFTPFLPIIYPEDIFIQALIALVGLFGIAVRFLVLSARLELARWLLIIGIWLILSLIYLTQGGIEHPALSAYILVIIFAALLRSPKAMIIVTVISVSMTSILLLLEQNNLFIEGGVVFDPVRIWVLNTFFLIIAASLLYLAAQIIATTLSNLRKNQAQLNLEIEERKQTQEEILKLAKSQEEIVTRYQSLFNQNNDAIFILDLDSKHIAANQRACELFDYTLEEILDLSIKDTVVSEELPNSENVRQRLFNNEKVPPYERHFRKKDGTVFPVEVNVELVHDANGEPLHIQSILRDISERKQLEAEKLTALIAQEHTNVLSNIISAVSHDFRTPLATIRTNLYLLQKSDDSERQSRYINRIDEQTRIITQMVDNLILLIRLNNNFELDYDKLDLQQFIPDYLQQTIDKLKSDVKLNYEIADDVLSIEVDSDLLKSALNHLIHNAIHHSQTEEPVQFNIRIQDNNVIFEVIDTGIGIAEENLRVIFEHFYRSDEARQLSLNASNGLGLPIVKRIVELHGGQVEVESKRDEGSTFRLYFPKTAPN